MPPGSVWSGGRAVQGPEHSKLRNCVGLLRGALSRGRREQVMPPGVILPSAGKAGKLREPGTRCGSFKLSPWVEATQGPRRKHSAGKITKYQIQEKWEHDADNA